MITLSDADRRRWSLFMMAFFVCHGVETSLFGAAAPRLQATFDLSASGLSLGPAAIAAGAIAGGLIGGGLGRVDRIRQTLQLMTGAIGILLVAHALAPVWAVFLGLCFLVPVAITVAITLIHGLIGRLAKPGETARDLGRVEASFSVGATVAPFLVGAMIALSGWRAAYLLAGLAFCGLLLVMRRLASLSAAGVAVEGGEGFAAYLGSLRLPLVRRMALVGVAGGVVELAHGAWAVVYGVSALGITEDAARLGLGAFAGGMLVSRLFLSRLAGWLGASRLLTLAAAVASMAAALLLVIEGAPAYIAVNLVYGLAGGIFFPTALLIGLERHPSLGNALSGVMILSACIGFQIGALGIGWIADAAGFRAAYLLILGAALAWLAGSVAYGRAAR